MNASKIVKPRKCRKCKQSFNVTAASIKMHAEKCKGRIDADTTA